MGISLGGAVNSASDWVCNARLSRKVVRNPIFTALLITALVVIVVMATYREQVKQGGGRKAARAFVYGLLAVTAVMVFHNHAVRRDIRCTAAQQDIRDVFTGIQVSRDLNRPALGGARPGPAACPAAAAPSAAPAPTAPSQPGTVEPRPNNLAEDETPWLGIEDVELPIKVGLDEA